MNELLAAILKIIVIVALIIGGIFGVVYIWSSLRIMNATSVGKAELARAEQNRQIKISTAQAEKEAAELQAESIRIVGQAAKDFPEYRHQEFLSAFGEALREGKMNQIIYVPTEANIPVMESGKR